MTPQEIFDELNKHVGEDMDVGSYVHGEEVAGSGIIEKVEMDERYGWPLVVMDWGYAWIVTDDRTIIRPTQKP